MIPTQLLPIITSIASSSLAQLIKRRQEKDEEELRLDQALAAPDLLLGERGANHSAIQLSEDFCTSLRQTTIRSNRTPHPVYEDFEAPTHGMWQEPGSFVAIGGIIINGGMFYVGDTLKGVNGTPDPCLINPALPVHVAMTNHKLPEWPSYQDLTAEQRAHYLQWLAGTRDGDIAEGYLWLYLGGLERYLLVDGPRAKFSTAERMQIESELQRLMTVYREKSRIANAITALLAMNWANTHDPLFAEALPKFMDFNTPNSGDLFPWRLGCYVAQRKQVPPHILLEWYMHHPRYHQHNLNPDTFSVFLSLFTERFQREYGDGFIIPQNKIPLSIAYQAANPCLGTLVFDFTGVSNLFEDCIYLERIKNIVETCAQELNDYAEYIKRPNSNVIGLLARMPQNILRLYPPFLAFQNTLAMTVQNGVAMINVQTLLETLGATNIYALDNEIANDIAILLQTAGFVSAPDVRYHDTIMPIHGQIVIAQRSDIPQKTPPFSLMAVILQLGAIVAQIDENISPTEVAILQNMILERKVLNDEQRASLLLWLHWCLNTPQNINAIAQKLDIYPESLQTHISQVLISVACADDILDTREFMALRKFYKALQIPENFVELHLKERGIELDTQKMEAIIAAEKQEKRQPIIHQARTITKPMSDEEFERMFYAESNSDEALSEELEPSSDTNYARRAAQYDFNPIECVEIDENLNAALAMICEPTNES